MKPDPAAETFIIPKELRHIIGALKGHAPIPDDQIVPVLRDKAFPITAAHRKEREKTLKNLMPGELLPSEGIFIGRYRQNDRDGKNLGKIFNVFASPMDLPYTMQYVEAVRYISEMKDWHGFDGTNYATDLEIYAALEDGSYDGGWIIPPRDILRGKDGDGRATTPDNLYVHKDKFIVAKDPKRAFNTTASRGSVFPSWYWSSTEDQNEPSLMYHLRFSNGDGGYIKKDAIRLSCRPVRLVAIPDL